MVMGVANSSPSSNEVKTELDPLAYVPVTAVLVILPKAYAALRLLYLTPLFFSLITCSVTEIVLDLLDAGLGREAEVVMILSLRGRGAWAVCPKVLLPYF